MIKPSFINFLIFCPVSTHHKHSTPLSLNNLREFAFAISVVSLGSSHTFFLPHFRTLEANRFCSLNVLYHVTTKSSITSHDSHTINIYVCIYECVCTFKTMALNTENC